MMSRARKRRGSLTKEDEEEVYYNAWGERRCHALSEVREEGTTMCRKNMHEMRASSHMKRGVYRARSREAPLHMIKCDRASDGMHLSLGRVDCLRAKNHVRDGACTPSKESG
jgi:hypothetical protein